MKIKMILYEITIQYEKLRQNSILEALRWKFAFYLIFLKQIDALSI